MNDESAAASDALSPNPEPGERPSVTPFGVGAPSIICAPSGTAAPANAGGGSTPAPSAELLAAQARLLALRAAQGVTPPRPDRSANRVCTKPVRPGSDDPPNWLLHNATVELQRRRGQLPQGRGGAGKRPVANAAAWLGAADSGGWGGGRWIEEPVASGASVPVPDLTGRRIRIRGDLSGLRGPATVTVHPTLLLALLKQHHEAPGRVYLLLRAIDPDGRGWLHVDDIRQHLTGQGSPLKFCGWRRLRQLLQEGEGLFWYRDGAGRVWLMGLHRIAYTLDLGRVQGFPVALPVASLLGGIRSVRAAFYASFHSGRESRPISRETLRDLSGLAPRTQLDYDRVAHVGTRRNLALGERHSTPAHQERAWQRGRGVFRFIDTEGRQGRPGGEYVAWHLPNSYEGPHNRRSRGHRRRLNRKLADLVNEGIPGNSEPQIERVFWSDGASAAKGFNRAPQTDAYWQTRATRGTRPLPGDGRVWLVLGRLGERGK